MPFDRQLFEKGGKISVPSGVALCWHSLPPVEKRTVALYPCHESWPTSKLADRLSFESTFQQLPPSMNTAEIYTEEEEFSFADPLLVSSSGWETRIPLMVSRNSGVLRMRDLGEHCFGKESIISLALNYNLRDEEGRWYPGYQMDISISNFGFKKFFEFSIFVYEYCYP